MPVLIQAVRSLPLMRKTFIEAAESEGGAVSTSKSLPLMRKTFIEAASTFRLSKRPLRLFRLCGRLSLRPRH